MNYFQKTKITANDVLSNISKGKVNNALKIFNLQQNNIQQDIIQILGKKRIMAGIPLILKALTNNNRKVLSVAIWSAGRLKIKESTERLQTLFQSTEDKKNKRSIIWAISEIRGIKNLSFLLDILLNNRDAYLNKSICLAFPKFGQKSVTTLIDTLRNKNFEITQQIADILIRIPGISDKIISLLKDDDKRIRRASAYILGEKICSESVDSLINVLKDDDLGVRGKAIIALGKIKDKKAIPCLVKFLQDKNLNIQKKIIKSLGNIGGEKALENLIRLKKKILPKSINVNILDRTLFDLGYNPRVNINREIKNKLEKDLKINRAHYLAEVTEGMENIAFSDINQKFSVNLIENLQGKIIFDYHGDIRRLRELKSVKNIYLFLTRFEKEETGKISALIDKLNKIDISYLTSLFQGEDNKFTFFLNLRELKGSLVRTQLSRILKQWLTEKTRWFTIPNGYNIEFKIIPNRDSLFLCLKLVDFLNYKREWRESLVSTSLEPSLAYLMCFLSGISSNDIFFDPMCGSGTIIIERALAGPYKKVIGSDIDKKAVQSTEINIKAAGQKIEAHQWDAIRLPLSKNSVTKVVVNMPYGIRVGKHKLNLKLYSLFFQELKRILCNRATIVILTQEKKLMHQILKENREFQLKKQITINIGGLQPDIFVLTKKALFVKE